MDIFFSEDELETTYHFPTCINCQKNSASLNETNNLVENLCHKCRFDYSIEIYKKWCPYCKESLIFQTEEKSNSLNILCRKCRPQKTKEGTYFQYLQNKDKWIEHFCCCIMCTQNELVCLRNRCELCTKPKALFT